MSETEPVQEDRREGGQPGNTNRLVHGFRCRRHGLVHAKLGRKFATAYADVCRLRRELERLVVEKHGSLSLMRRAKIQTIARVEEGIRACELMIRDHQNLGPEEVRQQREAIHRWTRERDKLIAELLGDAGNAPGDPWASLDASPTEPAESLQDAHQSDPTTEDDSEATPAISSASEAEPAESTG